MFNIGIFVLLKLSCLLGCASAVDKYDEPACTVEQTFHWRGHDENTDKSHKAPPPAVPKLFDLDDYDGCLASRGGTYCMLDLELAEEQSELYQYLLEHSKDTRRHFNVTRLHRGICISDRCHARSATRNHKDLLSCLNVTIYRENGLQVASLKVLYCDSAEDQPTPDILDLTVAGVLGGIFVISVVATALHQAYGDERTNKYIIAFSIMRNWKILTDSSSKRNTSDNLRSMQGIRFVTILMIISIHCFMVSGIIYTSNAKSIEQLYSGPVSVFIANLRFSVDVFFVMSGFLLAHQSIRTDNLSVGQLSLRILSRYLRILPTIMVVAGLNATWVSHLGSGPLWTFLVGRERKACRDSWWMQLVLMQNYQSSEKMCLMQTWHMAADIHFYILGLLLTVIIRKHFVVLPASLIISLVAPFLQTYIQELKPIVAAGGPEASLSFLKGNKTFANAYFSSVGHFSSFLLGMATAFVHNRATLWKWNLQSSKVMKLLFYFSMPLALGTIYFSGQYLGSRSTNLEAASTNVLDQCVFVLAFCLFLLGCINGCVRIITICLEWSPLQPLGRLCFNVSLVHTVFLWTYFGRARSLVEFSTYNNILMVTGISCLSFLLSVPLHLIVEMPSCHLVKIWLPDYRRQPTNVVAPKNKPQTTSATCEG